MSSQLRNLCGAIICLTLSKIRQNFILNYTTPIFNLAPVCENLRIMSHTVMDRLLLSKLNYERNGYLPKGGMVRPTGLSLSVPATRILCQTASDKSKYGPARNFWVFVSAETFWRSTDLGSKPRGEIWSFSWNIIGAAGVRHQRWRWQEEHSDIGDKDGRLWRSGDMGAMSWRQGIWTRPKRNGGGSNCEWAPTSDACARLFHSLFWQAALWQHCYVPTFASGGTQRDGDMMGW